MAYNYNVELFQDIEYPMLKGTTYLDHGGTTIYAKSLIDTVAADLVSNLYGNPHSASDPAMLSGRIVDDTRIKTLEFFGADPEEFDLIFVANATAAIKLVMEAFKDLGNSNRTPDGKDGGFRYFYHVDAHNSLVGVRETAGDDHRCFRSDAEVENWLDGRSSNNGSSKIGLFAYPGQSNMTGRRLPPSWTGKLRNSSFPHHQDTYSLLDAAALATTYPLDGIFRDPDQAPDFTALSFYKIFGFPDLGGLIVRKSSGNILQWGRKYFGGGTVQAVTVLGSKPWFKSRDSALHDSLEDGTLPFHSIIALNAAIDTHQRLYGPECMKTISRHTTFLGRRLYEQLSALTHSNGRPVCKIYQNRESTYGDSVTQGATIAFNVLGADGKYVPYTSVVETLANNRKIFVRAGQLCNPGGIATHLGFEDWHIKRLLADGHRCGGAHGTGTEIVNGKPTGVVRVSLGAMTTIANIDSLLLFLREEFVSSVPGLVGTVMPLGLPPRQINLPQRTRREGSHSEHEYEGQMTPQDYIIDAVQRFPPTPAVSSPSSRAGGYDFDQPNLHMMTPRRMDRSTSPNIATNFDQLLGRDFGNGMGISGDTASNAGDDRSANGLKKLWKHKGRKQSLAGSVF